MTKPAFEMNRKTTLRRLLALIAMLIPLGAPSSRCTSVPTSTCPQRAERLLHGDQVLAPCANARVQRARCAHAASEAISTGRTNAPQGPPPTLAPEHGNSWTCGVVCSRPYPVQLPRHGCTFFSFRWRSMRSSSLEGTNSSWGEFFSVFHAPCWLGYSPASGSSPTT